VTPDPKTVERHVFNLLEVLLGEDFIDENPHLAETPERVAKSLIELTTPTPFNFTVFENKDINQLVAVTDIPFFSLCAHHLLPFYGMAHIGYVPNELMAGLSKLSRTVQHFMRGLNIQEEMTQDILSYIEEHLKPLGVMVVVEGEHLCMTMRGAHSSGRTTTSAISGVFKNPKRGARTEFLDLIGRQ